MNYFKQSLFKNILMTKNGVSTNFEIGQNFTKLKFENESQNSGFQEISNILDSNLFLLTSNTYLKPLCFQLKFKNKN